MSASTSGDSSGSSGDDASDHESSGHDTTGEESSGHDNTVSSSQRSPSSPKPKRQKLSDGGTTLAAAAVSSQTRPNPRQMQYSQHNPWSKLLSQSQQHLDIHIGIPTWHMEIATSGSICRISRLEPSGVAVLEVEDNSGDTVLYNSEFLDGGSERELQSGDELCIHYQGHSYCYIFQNMSEEKSQLTRISQQASGNGILRKEILVGMVEGKNVGVSFDDFPYYLSEITKNSLVAASLVLVHLTYKEYVKRSVNMSNLKARILLSGPEGSEIYQEALAKALANHLGVKLLTFDRDTVLGALTTKEIESLKVQTHDLIGNRKSSDLSAGEGDASSPPITRTFTEGDRVSFYCPTAPSTPRGPSHGSKGKVVLAYVDNPSSKVGVRFDEPIPDGVDLGSLCEKGYGFFCSAVDLLLDSSGSEDIDELLLNTLFEVVREESRTCPLILYLKNTEKLIVGNSGSYSALKSSLEHLSENVVVLGSHTHSDNPKEEDIGRPHELGMQVPNATEFLKLLGIKDIGQPRELGMEVPETTKLLKKLFGNEVRINSPQDKNLRTVWNNLLDRDSKTLQMRANIKHLRTVVKQCGLECDGIEKLCIEDLTLDSETAEKIIGWALSDHPARNPDADPNAQINLSLDSIHYGIRLLKGYLNETAFSEKQLKDIAVEKEVMKRFSSDVTPPEDIGVTFNDIGALQTVKDILEEMVIAPFRLPELFCKEQLTEACKGILLYGPPGTGKTMLAKALAVEAGANFISISMSSIASNKWYGQADNYVKAVFSLASKKAPCVIFVDEVDSVLGERQNPGGHLALSTPEIKNAFMNHWGLLLKKEKERVLFLAATNRPFDLDETVIRQFSRRLLVGLPDGQSRTQIIRAILGKKALSSDVDLERVASMAEGYSGQDLKNLCGTASRRPIKEIYDKEKRDSALAIGGKDTKPARDVRPLNMQDFLESLKQGCSTVSMNMTEFQAWNKLYGEELSRKSDLSYFM